MIPEVKALPPGRGLLFDRESGRALRPQRLVPSLSYRFSNARLTRQQQLDSSYRLKRMLLAAEQIHPCRSAKERVRQHSPRQAMKKRQMLRLRESPQIDRSMLRAPPWKPLRGVGHPT